MTKQKIALQRQELTESINNDLYISQCTYLSAQSTAIYPYNYNYFFNSIVLRHLYNTYYSKIELKDITTSNAIIEISKNASETMKIGVLDFASFTNPGGGYLKGSVAQEEDLCENSNLYNILIKHTPFYLENKKLYMYDGLYSNRQLYIPRVLFMSTKELHTYQTYANVVVCAAPNIKRYKENNHFITAEAYYNLLLSRIDSILNTFMINHNDVIILGAFGCGVFGNDPTMVAQIFKELLEVKYRGVFRYVIFAIPKSNRNKNYEIFDQILNNK